MRVVDLSVPLFDGMPVYPGDPPVSITTVRTRESDGWELRRLELGSHTGTHVDAPVHMHAGGATLDDVPLAHFCGPAVALRTTDDFPTSAGLLFVDAVGADVVDRIVASGAPFVAGPLEEEAEHQLLAHGIITYTNLINVELLLGQRFIFVGLPLRIQSGDGSPVRAVALVEDLH